MAGNSSQTELEVKDALGRTPEIHYFRNVEFLRVEQSKDAQHTFFADEELPSLPLPDLSNTLKLYLQSVRAVVSNDDVYGATEKIVKEFELNVGGKLQELLKVKAEKEKNWIERFWYEYVYLRPRMALIPCCNMGGPAGPNTHYWRPIPSSVPWKERRDTQVYRAAFYAYTVIQVWLSLRREFFIPNKRRVTKENDNENMDMSQYRRVFNTCRIPLSECDTIINYFRTQREGSCPSHVTVACRGYLFWVKVTYENDNGEEELASPQDIHRAFQSIVEHVEKQATWGCCIGALTTQERDIWASCRRQLISLSMNENSHALEMMQSSIVHVVLDDREGVDPDTILLQCMCIEPCNAWADKSYTIIGNMNGLFCCNSDHSPLDGMVNAFLGVYMDQQIYINKGVMPNERNIEETSGGVLALQWKPIEFVLNDFIQENIDKAIQDNGLRCSTVTAHECIFQDFGRGQVRKWMQHPDTFIQMALHLAYYHLHGKVAPTYETASTRSFYHGRTETLRSCTPQMVQWCQTMSQWVKEESAMVLNEGDKVTTLRPLSQKCLNDYSMAANEHNRLRRLCEMNHGCDRHLLALQLLWRELSVYWPDHEIIRDYPQLPGIYQDPSWRLSGGDAQFVLSTSFGGYFTTLGAMPPMIADGYGVFYRIGPDRIHFNVTSYTNAATSVKDLARYLKTSLKEIEILLNMAQSYSNVIKQQTQTSAAKL